MVRLPLFSQVYIHLANDVCTYECTGRLSTVVRFVCLQDAFLSVHGESRVSPVSFSVGRESVCRSSSFSRCGKKRTCSVCRCSAGVVPGINLSSPSSCPYSPVFPVRLATRQREKLHRNLILFFLFPLRDLSMLFCSHHEIGIETKLLFPCEDRTRRFASLSLCECLLLSFFPVSSHLFISVF